MRIGSLKSRCLLPMLLLSPICLAQLPAGGEAPSQPQSHTEPDVNLLHREPTPPMRVPRQIVSPYGALQGLVLDADGRPAPGVEVMLASPGARIPVAITSGDGVFRILRIPPGSYQLVFARAGVAPVRRRAVDFHPGEVLSVEIHLPDSPTAGLKPLQQIPMESLDDTGYRELSRRPDADGAVVVPIEPPLPPSTANFQPNPDRWEAQFPDYHRYGLGPESPYILGSWFDPFNRNILKGDKPLFGKTFFNFTGDAITATDGFRLPTPAGQSTAQPNSPQFFGRGGQFLVSQTFRMTFDLFHGDTSAFRPVDWRVRITPAANVNYLRAREFQVVNVDVRAGTTRVDGHVGLQEAFGEVKLHDFGPNYDFVNLRVGIQQFVSDFRGFVFADEQPGVRIFGNLKSNRFQYNLAGFDLLEKDTNSGLNTFHRRSREVALANLFIQDFFAEGYTAQFSYHFVRDNANTYYDNNGRIERPAPIGNVIPHRIEANYFGWTGDGHIRKYNITHAFYQVIGHDGFSQIAGKRTDINAQFVAAEVSQDHDFYRIRTSFLYASGDDDPRDGTARGFSSIVDGVGFAGGQFSFFNREGIPLTRAGVSLKSPTSFLADLRTSKDEGQSNFVNPGLYLYNAGFDADLTQKLKLIGNVNFLQFARTQPLVFLLQQAAVRRTIGLDSGLGIIYRPLLSDNIIIQTGATSLVPFRGLRDIYSSQTLISVFGLLRFQF